GRRLGDALNVDAPARQLGGETGILPFAANCQRELVVGHDDSRRAACLRLVVEEHGAHTRRAQCLRDEVRLRSAPLDNVDLLAVELLDDALDANAAHANTRPDGVRAGLQRGDGDLRARAGFAGDALNLDRAVV